MSIAHRRQFILRLASVSTAIAAGGVLSGCGGGDTEDDGDGDGAASAQAVFELGVASGDPLSDRVVLWTHVRHADATQQADIALDWEVALDPAFVSRVASGQATAGAQTGFTAKVDATGLQPGQDYFFRFKAGSSVSPVGRTRTLPAAGAERVRLAVFSCANYPAGFFHAYSEAVRAGAEYAVHLGDYIYEYPADGYASADAAALGRVSVPAHECITLEDYRARYAQYRSDPDLKQLHANLPLIAVWDDHEIANDAYASGAENHTTPDEGSFSDRVSAALQAYHEWMPIRTPDMADLRTIYRSFDFGGLLSLHMLETRLLGREQPIGLLDLVNPATAASAAATLASPTRQMLGAAQQSWLTAQLTASQATWQVLGQQVLMGRMAFPVSILQALNPDNATPEAQAAAAKAIEDYLTAKATAAVDPAALTPTQQNLLNPSLNPLLGYNLDAWDGYPAAREILLGTVANLGKPLVVLAGDTHNAWHSDLALMDGTKVGEEFATSSVSSPGLEEYLVTLPPAQTAAIFRGVIDTLKYADTARRGFLLMDFSATSVTGTWHLLNSVKAGSYTASLAHTHTWSLPAQA